MGPHQPQTQGPLLGGGFVEQPLEEPHFGGSICIRVPRDIDETDYTYLKFRVAPLARGYKWRDRVQLRSIERSELTFAGTPVDVVTCGANEIKYLQTGLAHYRDAMFGPLSAEREQTYITPLHDMAISHVKLYYCEVRMNLYLAPLETLVERDTTVDVPEPLVDPIMSVSLVSYGTYLTYEARRATIQENKRLPSYHPVVLYPSETQIVPTSESFRSSLLPDYGIASCITVLVQDADGREIGAEIVDQVKCIVNGYDRCCVSGYEARFMAIESMPIRIRETIDSQNLYFIPLTSDEQHQPGLNLHRVDTCQVLLRFKTGAGWAQIVPDRVKVTLMYRVIGREMCLFHGMGGITEGPWPRPPGPIRAPILVGPNTDCPVTLEPLVAGQAVSQCHRCLKVFSESALNSWFAESHSRGCPHCRATLGFTEGIAVVETD